MTAEPRKRKFWLVVGAAGTGKSTWVRKKLVDPWPENCIVHKDVSNIDDVAFEDLTLKDIKNFRQGAAPNTPVKCRMVGNDPKTDWKEFLEWQMAQYRNGMTVIDDAANFEYDRPSQTMAKMARMRRHIGIELVMVYHGMTDIPIELLKHVNFIVIFNTVDNISYKAKKFGFYNDILKATEMARANYLNPATMYSPVSVKLY